jgi:hypothetical protein
MKWKGVNYDVGRVLEGRLTRPTFDSKETHREIEIIKNDLHCNSIKVQGFEIDRVMIAAQDSLEQGLEVWLAPEMFEESQDRTHDYCVKAASAAEALRKRWPERLVLSIGTELTLFMQGILPGNNLMERLGNPAIWGKIKTGAYDKPLNEFLAKTTSAVRSVFHGKVTYASVARVERVDWSIFDFVCVDAYRDKLIRDSFGDMIKSYRAHGRPVVIGEFGCCTYQGAEDMGGMGWDVVDWSAQPPRLKGNYVYDQSVQAREIVEDLQIFDRAGVEGAFVFTFVQPPAGINDPAIRKILEGIKFDPDAVSYSLVKSYLNGRGTAYPDMLWEPKESFKAVAEYYASN